MNLLKTQTLHPHLRDEEALVVENAIRLAIDSIVNVLYGVSSARAREHQRTVADRDQQIQRLEGSVAETARELKLLRRQGCACAPFGKERSLVTSQPTTEESGFEPSGVDTETTAGRRERETSASLGLFARPPSHVSSQSHESALLQSSPSQMGLDRSGVSDSSGASEEAGNLPRSPGGGGGLVIKEEPCDIDAVLIKWEMSEERFRDLQESPGSLDMENPCKSRNLEHMEGRTLNENFCADPSGYYDLQEEQLRSQKKGAPVSEQTEEAQRLKRAAWRAASRRYYARKVARQQENPSQMPVPSHSGPAPFPSRSGPAPFLSHSGLFSSHSSPFPSRPAPFPSRPAPFSSRPAPFPSLPFPHATDSRYAQPVSFADKKRRTLISDLPEASQSLQREAWRAASKRYYARKNARHHQTEPVDYERLLQNMEPPGDPLEPNRGESHGNGEGILCS